MAKGESGYVQAQVTVTIGGTYTGGGLAGWSGGTDYQFSVKARSPSFKRPGQDTTDGAYVSQVGGPIKVDVDMTGYYKGTNYPVNFAAYEFVKMIILPWTGFTFTGVVQMQDFTPTGDVEKAAEYSIKGVSDGTFTYS